MLRARICRNMRSFARCGSGHGVRRPLRLGARHGRRSPRSVPVILSALIVLVFAFLNSLWARGCLSVLRHGARDCHHGFCAGHDGRDCRRTCSGAFAGDRRAGAELHTAIEIAGAEHGADLSDWYCSARACTPDLPGELILDIDANDIVGTFPQPRSPARMRALPRSGSPSSLTINQSSSSSPPRSAFRCRCPQSASAPRSVPRPTPRRRAWAG